MFMQLFNVGTEYEVNEPVGKGGYGEVCSALHKASGTYVAVKKMARMENPTICLRALREVKILDHLHHDNIVRMLDLVIPHSVNDFHEMYIIQELMDTNCDLKICDFGLARHAASQQGKASFLTEYVVTRWYRAPEVMLSPGNYTSAIDIWSVGCVMAEMLGGGPLFPARDRTPLNVTPTQPGLMMIFDILGTPALEDYSCLKSYRTREYIRSLPHKERLIFQMFYPSCNGPGLDLLQSFLAFNPDKRITAEEALRQPYLEGYRGCEDGGTASAIPTEAFGFERERESSVQEVVFEEMERLSISVKAPRCLHHE